jgi:hypothetical protein
MGDEAAQPVRIDLVDGKQMKVWRSQIDYEAFGIVITDPGEKTIVPWGRISLVVEPGGTP